MAEENQNPPPERYVGNLLLPIVIVTLATVFFFQTFDFPTGEDVGPAVVPYLWIVFTALFCGALVFQAATRRLKADPVPGKVGFVILFVAWLGVYVAAIETIGYFVSTLVFLIASMYVMTYRNHLVIFAVSLGWLVFAYFVFVQLLYIPLPIGPLLAPVLQ